MNVAPMPTPTSSHPATATPLVGVAGAVALGTLLVACGGSRKKTYDDYRFQADPKPAVKIAHPSATDALPDNTFMHKKREHHGALAEESWFSVTEVSSERVCIDFGSFQDGRATENFELARILEAVESGGIWLSSEVGGRFPVAVFKRRLSTPIREQRRVIVPRAVETGRFAMVCVEDLVNRYGTVVGCRRSEEQPITTTEYHGEDVTMITHDDGIRMCAKNDGIVAPHASWFGVAIQDRDHSRVELTNGVAKAGKWGAIGGRSALKPRAAPSSAPRAASSSPSRATSSSPMPTTEATVPRPGEQDLLSHRGRKLKLQPFKMVDPKGATVLELDIDGKLHVGARVVAWLGTDGIARQEGHATFVYDRASMVWTNHQGKARRVGKLDGNLMNLGTEALTVTGGRFVFSGKRRRKMPNRAVPATVSPELLLFVAVVTDGAYLGTPSSQ